VLFINWSRFDFFAGVHSFSNPLNYQGTGTAEQRDGTGSFGFHEGFNYGKCHPWLCGGHLSSQFGLRATHSNLDGAEFTDDERQQIFLTVGLFRRVDFGLQGGVVFDYLYDEWNYRANVTQIRGELSWRTRCPTEFGYRFAVGTNRPEITTVINDHINALSSATFRVRATEQHRLFYRRHLSAAAFGELSLGVTDNADALFGGQVDVPLNCHWGLTTGFTWAIGDGRESIDHQQESWNMFVGMMYRPAGNRNRKDYHAPLLPVADNGSMMLDRF
jgi:hypothetical protein